MKLIDILARELPKRGGWPIESNGCRQFPDGEVCFSNVGKKPDFYTECATDVDLVWRKTVTPHVSREQYEAALAAKNEGWIEWAGGECPIQEGVLVKVKYRNEKDYHIKGTNCAGRWSWEHYGTDGDIIAYRLHKPQEVTDTDDEADLNECIGQDAATAWNGDGLPPVGCECEYQYKVHGSEWRPLECVAVDGKVVFGWSNNTPVALQSNTHNFRPLRSEADKKREEAIMSIAKAGGAASFKYGEKFNDGSLIGAAWYELYDAIAAGKIPGVKLED